MQKNGRFTIVNRLHIGLLKREYMSRSSIRCFRSKPVSKRIQPITMTSNGYGIATDLLSFLTSVPYSDCVVFNQVIQIPGQRKLLRKLQAKAKRHGSMPDPSNRIAKADIEEVLDRLAVIWRREIPLL